MNSNQNRPSLISRTFAKLVLGLTMIPSSAYSAEGFERKILPICDEQFHDYYTTWSRWAYSSNKIFFLGDNFNSYKAPDFEVANLGTNSWGSDDDDARLMICSEDSKFYSFAPNHKTEQKYFFRIFGFVAESSPDVVGIATVKGHHLGPVPRRPNKCFEPQSIFFALSYYDRSGKLVELDRYYPPLYCPSDEGQEVVLRGTVPYTTEVVFEFRMKEDEEFEDYYYETHNVGIYNAELLVGKCIPDQLNPDVCN